MASKRCSARSIADPDRPHRCDDAASTRHFHRCPDIVGRSCGLLTVATGGQ
jgi:hypothetical protein